MNTTTTRLTGGHAGYREAVDEAFRVNMHNPSVIYSTREGFSVQSMLTPLDDDEYRVGEAHYCLNYGGEPNMTGSRGEYDRVRTIIAAWLVGGNEAAEEAEHAYDCPY